MDLRDDVFGIPISVCVSRSSSCLDLRLAIWKQLSRMFYPQDQDSSSSEQQTPKQRLFGQAIWKADVTNNIQQQRRFAAALPIRLVNQNRKAFLPGN